MTLIPEERIEEVRNATDLADLVARYTPVTRSGKGFKALCPFHREKTPSFYLWPETQTWMCFGCGKGGNTFTFLMERERLEFPEAVRFLAREAGITLDEGGSGERRDGRAELFAALEWACCFYENMLRREEGRAAVEYCQNRGLTGETAKVFRMGMAPPGWRALLEAARGRGFSVELLERAGLVRTGDGQPWDWFRNRLTFPIQDVRGRVIGFGARSLDDSEPKYLNSPETALFKKGRTLYALHLAREEAMRSHRLGVVEGYTDVVMAWQHGVRNLVAGLGTSLTGEHAALARRYAERIDLTYDGDAAGLRAAERALGEFLAIDADVRVVELPSGQDPCDFVSQRGEDEFRAVLDAGREVFDFLLSRASTRHDVKTVAGRTAAIDELLTALDRVNNPVKRDLLFRTIAEAFGIEERSLRDRLRAVAPRDGSVKTGPEFAGSFSQAEVEDPAERWLLEAVLHRPDLLARLGAEWPPERFTGSNCRRLAEDLLRRAERNGELDPAAMAASISEPATAELAARLLVSGAGKDDFSRQFEDCVARLSRSRAVTVVRRDLEEARRRGDEEEVRRLARELFQLQGKRR